MENVFIKYLSKKAKKEEVKAFKAGPVITISRQYGCYATDIANRLVKLINKKSTNPWDVISKEILEESAKRLEVSTHEVALIFGANEKSFLSDIMVSFSPKTYKSDSVIIKTIRTVVKQYAEQGNCVIVGRAGCVVAEHIEKAFHVRLTAPSEYRISQIQNRFDISEKEAIKRVNDTDKKRNSFMKFFKGDKPDEDIFDLTLNRGKLKEDEITELIISLAESRKLV